MQHIPSSSAHPLLSPVATSLASAAQPLFSPVATSPSSTAQSLLSPVATSSIPAQSLLSPVAATPPAPSLLNPPAASFFPTTAIPPARPNTRLTFPVYDVSDSPAAPSPLREAAWASALQHYPDPAYVDAVLGGIRHGLRLGYTGPLRQVPARHHRTLRMTEEGLAHVRHEVTQRLASGDIVRGTPTDSISLSPVGTVPKGVGKWRTIHHLSYPRNPGRPSVNDGISPDDVTLSYSTLEPLFADIRAQLRAQRQPVLFKADLADAFRHCVVGIHDSRLLGFALDGEVYRDTRLSFGCRSSPFLFNLYSEGLHWIVESRGVRLSHYLDDFFGCAAGSAVTAMQVFRASAVELGFRLREEKVEQGPVLEILRVLVDAQQGTASISQDRRDRVLGLVNAILVRKTASALELMAIASHLVFITRVCPPGRAFLRRVYDAAAPKLHIPGRLRLPHTAKLDLRWWRAVLHDWNGVLLIDPERTQFEPHTFKADSTPSRRVRLPPYRLQSLPDSQYFEIGTTAWAT
jgi:hypothetical protein